jgi:hypothetical protein
MSRLDISKQTIWAVLSRHGAVPHQSNYYHADDDGTSLTCDPVTESIVISGRNKLGECERALTEAGVPFVRHEGYIEVKQLELEQC